MHNNMRFLMYVERSLDSLGVIGWSILCHLIFTKLEDHGCNSKVQIVEQYWILVIL